MNEQAADAHTNMPMRDALEQEIAKQAAFQRRWRIISMSGYSVTTVGSLLSSASATICAGVGFNLAAAVLAATSTVLLGTEKALLFREKWKFHLMMHTKLTALSSQFRLSRITTDDAADQFNEIMISYAQELPMAGRELGA